MEKVITFPRPEDSLSDLGPGMLDRANRTFICTVLFLDIVEYSKKPVSQQLRLKEQFNARLSEALQDIAANDRIILDTGDGAAINFLGDPEDALFVAISLAQSFGAPPEGSLGVDVRIGINLGPVRLVHDINSQLNIIGDGINVAERVMSFASTGQVLVSRSYYEVVTRIAEDYTRLFAYHGSRTDKHVREHELYGVASSGTEALDVTTRRHRARPQRPALKLIDSAQARPQTARAFAWFGKITPAYAAAAVSCLVLTCAVVYYLSDQAASRDSGAARFAPAIRLAEPAPAPSASTRPTQPSTAAAAQSHPARATGKKSSVAHQPLEPLRTLTQAPAPVQTALKTATPEASAPGPAVAPWRPYSEGHKPEPAASASGADAAAPAPYTAAAPKVATALVMLAVSPWGEVLVDGKSVGVSPPLSELELKPGAHRVEIRNGDFAAYLETLQLEPNQTIKIKHKFHAKVD